MTNVEADHLDHFGTLGNLRDAFAAFVAGIDGPRVVCADDRFLAGLEAVRYGSGAGAAYRLAAWTPTSDGADIGIDALAGFDMLSCLGP